MIEKLESLEGRTWLGGEGNRHLKESNFSPLFDLSILLFASFYPRSLVRNRRSKFLNLRFRKNRMNLM